MNISVVQLYVAKKLAKSDELFAEAEKKLDKFAYQRLVMNQPVSDLPEVHLMRLELKDAKGNLLDRNDYWMNGKNVDNFLAFNNLDKVDIKIVSCREVSEGIYEFSVRNEGKVPAIGVKFNVTDPATGASVLPAYFSDGYFTLLPREKKTVRLELPKGITPECISTNGYNVMPQVFSM